MSSINNKLKQLRKEQKLTQVELADKLGVVKQTISRIENDLLPSDNILSKYSDFFDISLSELMTLKLQDKIKYHNIQNKNVSLVDLDEFLKENDILAIPYFLSLHDSINDKNQYTLRVALLKNSYSQNNNVFAIKFNGESMNKIIPNQFIAIIDQGAKIKSGDVIAYQFDNDCGIKRFIENQNMIKLEPESIYSEFQERTISKENIDKLQFKIIGKVIDVKSNFNQ